MIKLAIFLVLVFIFSIFSNLAVAQDQPTATTELKINSFELFWPVVAGKTLDDPYYFVKDFKEKLRGWLIFGTPQKADYNVLLATKRLLEADKLIQAGKTDLANQTFSLSQNLLDQAMAEVSKAKNNKESFGDSGKNMVSMLSNIETYITYTLTTQTNYKGSLQKILTTSQKIKSQLR